MGKKRKTEFTDSLSMNMDTYYYYLDRLEDLALSRFQWKNLPPTCDERYLETALLNRGSAVFLYDDVLESLYSLSLMSNGEFDMYGYPTERTAWGYNGAMVACSPVDSVLVYNNMRRCPIKKELQMFAKRLYTYDRVADVNVNSNKTPVLIVCSETERLSMENLYKMYDGNERVIFGNTGFKPEAIQVLQTGAPFIADQINELKNRVWNEALTFLGIYNIDQKKAQTSSMEVQRSQGGTVASRFSPLAMRMKACEEVNSRFGFDISCEYREMGEYADALILDDYISGGVPADG